jgi:hypothetical protein
VLVIRDLPHGKASALIVGQPESTATELLLQNTIFLTEIFDDRVLLTSDPARHGGDEDLPGLEDSGHWSIMPTSRDNRQLSSNDETA